MAGAGYKSFTTGDVLTASDLNTYGIEQTIMVLRQVRRGTLRCQVRNLRECLRS